ncbi:MAG: hypothetical protein P8M16_02505 [Acidimicrobiales bacterium]|nr:hypothetical protein [Acidimicrobiales bacterium]
MNEPYDSPDRNDVLVIDCLSCSQKDTSTCDDCMVTFLCNREPGDAVVVNLVEFKAMRVLGESGLVPPMRHSQST